MNKLIKNWDCQITTKKKLWYTISISLIVIGLIITAIFGFNIGIDFSGGTVVTFTADNLVTNSNVDSYMDTIVSTLESEGIEVEVQQTIEQDGDIGVQVRYQNTVNGTSLSDADMFAVNDEIEALLYTAVKAELSAQNTSETAVSIESKAMIEMSTVGASASAELLLNAFISVLAAAALILLYVAIRFELWSGVSAVIALAHDILIMIAFVAIFQIQINASFVAALITIVGYSINNTIVLFDRLRENKAKYTMRDATPSELVNTSIKDTMTRSINTTITTLVTITILAIIGVSAIKEFAIPIIIGLLAGTYSSIFIAPTLWGLFQDLKIKKAKAAAKK
ncbi:MAG: protein translocase subunit SecF [Bacillota bacterium]